MNPGPEPTNDNDQPLQFPNYGDAKYYLVKRLGPFCSYCERHPATHINVEHIEPRALGGAVSAWNNFLLACQNCNSAKGKKPVAGKTFYFPHTHNTAFAFEYRENAVILPNPALDPAEQAIAQETLELFGLHDLKPSAPRDPDRRFDDYLEQWGTAAASRDRMTRNPSAELCDTIAGTARSTGAFSIYLAVFHDAAATRRCIIQRFSDCGTRLTCFDANGDVVADLHR